MKIRRIDDITLKYMNTFLTNQTHTIFLMKTNYCATKQKKISQVPNYLKI